MKKISFLYGVLCLLANIGYIVLTYYMAKGLAKKWSFDLIKSEFSFVLMIEFLIYFIILLIMKLRLENAEKKGSEL